MSSTGVSLQHDGGANQVGEYPVPRKAIGNAQTITPALYLPQVRDRIFNDFVWTGLEIHQIAGNLRDRDRRKPARRTISYNLRYEIRARLKARVA